MKNDTLELRSYLESYDDNKIINAHISYELKILNRYYDSASNFSESQKLILKLKKLSKIAVSFEKLKLANPKRVKPIQDNILEFKNAWFVDFGQYNSLQDSLEGVFNKIYQADLSKMVQSLK